MTACTFLNIRASYWSASAGFRLLGEIPAGAITLPTGMATQMQFEIIFEGNRIAPPQPPTTPPPPPNPRLVKRTQPKETIKRRKRKQEIVPVSLLSKVLSSDKLSRPRIWNIEKK